MSILCEEFADCFWDEQTFAKFLVFVVFQTILELAERFIDGLDRFHAVPAKIMGGVFQVFLGAPERTDGFPNFGVRFRQSRGRGRWLGSRCRNCRGSRRPRRSWSCRHRQTQRQCKDHQGRKSQDFQFHCALHDVQDFLAGSRNSRRRHYCSSDRTLAVAGE